MYNLYVAEESFCFGFGQLSADVPAGDKREGIEEHLRFSFAPAEVFASVYVFGGVYDVGRYGARRRQLACAAAEAKKRAQNYCEQVKKDLAEATAAAEAEAAKPKKEA